MAPVNQAFKAPEEVFSHAPATSVSPGCRWTIRLSSVHGSCCCCPKTQSQSVSWKHCTSRTSGPGQGIGIVPASAAPGGTSCESSGLSRSRKCSWGNRWRSEATPPRTQATPARCSLRPLQDTTQRLRIPNRWEGDPQILPPVDQIL